MFPTPSVAPAPSRGLRRPRRPERSAGCKYKDDPNWWTHSLLREGYGKDKHWVLLRLPSRDSA